VERLILRNLTLRDPLRREEMILVLVTLILDLEKRKNLTLRVEKPIQKEKLTQREDLEKLK